MNERARRNPTINIDAPIQDASRAHADERRATAVGAPPQGRSLVYVQQCAQLRIRQEFRR
jgi:hypothetical protein